MNEQDKVKRLNPAKFGNAGEGPPLMNFYLAAGLVMFYQRDDKGEQVGSLQNIAQNTLVVTGKSTLGVEQLAQIQQGLQQQFWSKMGEEAKKNFMVVDCITTAIIPLGRMSWEQFNARPAGMAMQETTSQLRGPLGGPSAGQA